MAKLLNRLIKILVAKKDKPLPESFEYPKAGESPDCQSRTGNLDFRRGSQESEQTEVCSVLQMETGSQGRILFLVPDQNGRLDRLSALGVIPGNTITLLQKQPSLVVQVDHTEIALDKEIAGEIFVRVGGRANPTVVRRS